MENVVGIELVAALEQQGEGLLADARLRNAVFDEEVLDGGLNSKPVELSTDHAVVLRVKEILPVRQQRLDEVKDQLVTRYKQEQAQTLLDQWSADAKTAVTDGEGLTFKAFAEAKGLPFQDDQVVGWRAPAVNPALLQSIFSHAKSESGELQPYAVGAGSRYVYVVKSSAVGETKLSDIERRSLTLSMQPVLGERDFANVADSVEQAVSIETF